MMVYVIRLLVSGDGLRHNGHELVDIAQAIVDSHLLLLPPLPQPATPSERPA